MLFRSGFSRGQGRLSAIPRPASNNFLITCTNKYSLLNNEECISSSTNDKVLHVKKLQSAAKIPTRGSRRSAGLDLYANENAIIPPHSRQLIATGVSISLPSGTYGRIASRSGLKHNIDVAAGVIDEDYRGEVKVLLCNNADKPYKVVHGDKIAQLIAERIASIEVEEVDEIGRAHV